MSCHFLPVAMSLAGYATGNLLATPGKILMSLPFVVGFAAINMVEFMVYGNPFDPIDRARMELDPQDWWKETVAASLSDLSKFVYAQGYANGDLLGPATAYSP